MPITDPTILPGCPAGRDIIASFDRLDLPAALVDARGRVRESTARLRALLRADAELLDLFGVPGRLLQYSRVLPVADAGTSSPPIVRCRHSRVSTAAGRYVLRAACMADVTGLPLCVVLVSAETAAAAELPRTEALVAAYRLTTREAEVALLLAEGASDRDVARGLNISPHTARKHTEHILHKMGMNSRKALGWRLLANGPQST